MISPPLASNANNIVAKCCSANTNACKGVEPPIRDSTTLSANTLQDHIVRRRFGRPTRILPFHLSCEALTNITASSIVRSETDLTRRFERVPFRFELTMNRLLPFGYAWECGSEARPFFLRIWFDRPSVLLAQPYYSRVGPRDFLAFHNIEDDDRMRFPQHARQLSESISS